MALSRLSYLLEQNGLSLPVTGRMGIWSPPAKIPLDILPRDRCEIITDHYPTARWYTDHGYTCLRSHEGGDYVVSLVFIPRARDEAREQIARASGSTDGIVIVDGAKTDGIETIYKDCRKLGTVSQAFSKAHGKIFWFGKLPGVENWLHSEKTIAPGFVTRPGVFSADGIDPASELLAETLPDHIGTRVIDLGAGWGYLAARALERNSIIQLDLVEANHNALDCARRNICDDRAIFHWHDATTWRPRTFADTVIMNPPFHSGRKTDVELGHRFITAGAAMLNPKGTLWLVANQHLPYEQTMQTVFSTVRLITKNNYFKVLRGSNPLRK